MTFTRSAWRKMLLYTALCPFEVSGLGLVDEVGSDYLVTDLRLVAQEVTPLATSLDGEAVSELIAHLLAEDCDPGRLKLWWHSHAREAVFWSGDDERTISSFQNEYMLSVVSNHARRTLARLDRYSPRNTAWVWVDPPPDGVDPTPAETVEAQATLDALVRRSS